VAKTIIQIYEVQDPTEAESLILLGVDHIGSVLVSPETWRSDAIKETMMCSKGSDTNSSVIPIFRDPDLISKMLDFYQPDIVHFCENLSNTGNDSVILEEALVRQQLIRERFPEISMMRTVPIAPPGQASEVPTLAIAHIFEPVSDFLLTDTLLINGHQKTDGSQPVNGYVGITGKTCDWDMAAKLVQKSSIPVILAGGISPDNVSEGISHVLPAGIDSCTGTNAVDEKGAPFRFKKDLQKVKQLVVNVRNMDTNINNNAI
jgi:phosphoribosylanthranilate isomerase